MVAELRLQVSEDRADAERLAKLASYLRAELLQLDVEEVTALQFGKLPSGARAAWPTTIGGLLVILGNSAKGLQSVISVIRDWLQRSGEPARMVRLELAGDSLELTHASTADQERLVELFVSRHAVGEGD
jgi:hypothetical protein